MFHFDLGAVYFFVCVCGGFILHALIKRFEEYVFYLSPPSRHHRCGIHAWQHGSFERQIVERWIIKRGRWPKITMEDYTGNGNTRSSQAWVSAERLRQPAAPCLFFEACLVWHDTWFWFTATVSIRDRCEKDLWTRGNPKWFAMRLDLYSFAFNNSIGATYFDMRLLK